MKKIFNWNIVNYICQYLNNINHRIIIDLGIFKMKIKKSFLICIFLLGILSLSFVCAEDNASQDNLQGEVPGEIAFENSQVM